MKNIFKIYNNMQVLAYHNSFHSKGGAGVLSDNCSKSTLKTTASATACCLRAGWKSRRGPACGADVATDGSLGAASEAKPLSVRGLGAGAAGPTGGARRRPSASARTRGLPALPGAAPRWRGCHASFHGKGESDSVFPFPSRERPSLHTFSGD